MPELFNEDTLRAEIVKVWGEHGAHVDVFDHILKEARKTVKIRELVRAENFEALIEDVEEIVG